MVHSKRLDFIGRRVKGSATFQSNLADTTSVKLSDKRKRKEKKTFVITAEKKKIDARNVKWDESLRALAFQISRRSKVTLCS